MPLAQLAPDSENFLAGTGINVCRVAKQWRGSWDLLSGRPIPEGPEGPEGLVPHDSISCALATGGQESQWPASLSLFHAMPSNGLTHSVESFASTMFSICDGGNWELALSLFEAMDVEQIQPNVVVYNRLIGACKAASQWDPWRKELHFRVSRKGQGTFQFFRHKLCWKRERYGKMQMVHMPIRVGRISDILG